MHAWYRERKKKRKGERREKGRETLNLPAWLSRGEGGEASVESISALACIGESRAAVYVVGRPGHGWMDVIYSGMDNRRCLQPSPSGHRHRHHHHHRTSPPLPSLPACLPACLCRIPVQRQSRAKTDLWGFLVRGCGCRVAFYDGRTIGILQRLPGKTRDKRSAAWANHFRATTVIDPHNPQWNWHGILISAYVKH